MLFSQQHIKCMDCWWSQVYNFHISTLQCWLSVFLLVHRLAGQVDIEPKTKNPLSRTRHGARWTSTFSNTDGWGTLESCCGVVVCNEETCRHRVTKPNQRPVSVLERFFPVFGRVWWKHYLIFICFRQWKWKPFLIKFQNRGHWAWQVATVSTFENISANLHQFPALCEVSQRP